MSARSVVATQRMREEKAAADIIAAGVHGHGVRSKARTSSFISASTLALVGLGWSLSLSPSLFFMQDWNQCISLVALH